MGGGAAAAGAIIEAVLGISGIIVEGASARSQQLRQFRFEKEMSQKERDVLTKKERSQAAQMVRFMETLEDEIRTGEVEATEAIDRIQDAISVLSGKTKRIIQASLAQGVEQLNSQQKMALDRLSFNLDQARADATESEKREIERAQKEVKELRRAHDKDTQAIKDTMVRRGVIGAPLAAMLNTSTERLGRAVERVHEASGKITGEIARQLAKVNAQGLMEQAALQSKALAERRALVGDAAIQEAKLELGLQEKGFAQTEAVRQRQQEQARDIRQAKGALGIEAAFLSGEEGRPIGEIIAKPTGRDELEGALTEEKEETAQPRLKGTPRKRGIFQID